MFYEYWFYSKKKIKIFLWKKQLIILTVFYISHENDIKTFLKWFTNKENVNEFPKSIY